MSAARLPVRRRDHFLLANEVALAGVTLAAVIGMHRLFVDGSYWWPLVLQAVAAHLVVALARRAGLGLPAAAGVTVTAAVLLITWTRFGDTTHWLLPTGETLSRAGVDLRAAWDLFGKVEAPAPVENGFLVASGAAIWVLAYLADWAAFRVSVTLEALLPATTLFVFAAALGGPGSRVAGAALFAGVALMYALLHRTSAQERTSRWAGGHRAQGRWSLVGTGAGIVGIAVVAGALAGPNLPGADADAVVAWRDLNKDDPTRVVISPIVQLKSRLLEQSDAELFTVRTSRPSYWRLTALEEFDGSIWKSSYATDDADGSLPRAAATESSTETVTQTVDIIALSSVWLPAAFEPTAIDGGDQSIDFDEDSSTLLVDRNVETSDGYRYTVTSEVADWSATELRGASAEVPDDIAATYTALPDDFPADVGQLARGIVEATGAATPFDTAHALQSYLRSDLFTYDEDVEAGHSQRALVGFLLRSRRGYCEQFAGSFAAMARYLGLPARVAIGFTSGVNDRVNDPTLYRVRGKHAHAWPEVYLGEYGWVPFEPTPTRGPPRAEDWLGIAPGQDTTSGGFADPEPEREAGPPAEGLPGVGATGDAPLLPESEFVDELGLVPGEGDGSLRLPQPVRDAARPLALGALGYLLVVPLAIATQHLVRRRRARAPAARTRYLWRQAVDQAQAAGVRLPLHLTIAEKAERLATAHPDHAPAIQALARTLEAVNYGGRSLSQDEVDAAHEAWAAVVTEARRRRSWRARALGWFDVRRLFGDRRVRLVARAGMGAGQPA